MIRLPLIILPSIRYRIFWLQADRNVILLKKWLVIFFDGFVFRNDLDQRISVRYILLIDCAGPIMNLVP